jgi:tRNA G18 (ribose-2'-O)-methylase SpoU
MTVKSPAVLLPGYILSFLSGALISLLGAQAYQAYRGSGFDSKNGNRHRHQQRRITEGRPGGGTFFFGSTRKDGPPNNGQGHDEDTPTNKGSSSSTLMDSPDLDYRLIRKAEAVIQGRTSRLLIVVERCTNDHNYSAILRTAEALGVQNLWIVDPPSMSPPVGGATNQQPPLVQHVDQHHRPVQRTAAEEAERVSHTLFAQRAQEWLTLRTFRTTTECLSALRHDGYTVWVTDLSQHAVPLDELRTTTAQSTIIDDEKKEDRRLAIVMGTEAVGCSREMLEGADLRVYLPLVGFADSLNLSVATALVVQYILEFVYPAARHNMDESERQTLREAWYPKLAKQRLLTPHEKRNLKQMKKTIDECERLQAKRQQGLPLTDGQEIKLQGLAELRIRFAAAQAALDAQARAAVQHLLDNPPAPLGDLRRADVHRISYVSKSTKRGMQQYWRDMPAVATTRGLENASCQDFRRGLQPSLWNDENDDDRSNIATTAE